MAETAFSQIQEAEAQARALIKDAQEEAVRIVKQTEADATEAYSQLAASHRRQSQDLRAQAEAQARTDNDTYENETAAAHERLEAVLLARKSIAVDAVIDAISGAAAD